MNGNQAPPALPSIDAMGQQCTCVHGSDPHLIGDHAHRHHGKCWTCPTCKYPIREDISPEEHATLCPGAPPPPIQ